MFYLSENTIVNAWMNIIKHGKITNKFFGLLEMIRVLNIDVNEKIKAQKQYNFKASNLANALQERFTFDEERSFKGSEKYWVIFSENWKDVVLSDFIGNIKVCLYDVAIICYQNNYFGKELSKSELINRFLEDYHLDSSVMTSLMYLEEKSNYDNIEWKPFEVSRKKLRNQLLRELNIEPKNTTIGFEPPYIIASNAGELSRAPFFQTLYASQSSMKCLICTKFNFFEQYKFGEDNQSKINTSATTSTNLTTKQKIYYGSPGTGKSTAMQKFATENALEVIRTTFHPDTDYFSFVGGYKPVMKGESITYQFVPQAFTKAYIRAYQNPDKNYLLAIEEINRGNCAQIFGDLFQCLDRNPDGRSCYPIDANADLANYLASQGLENSEQIILPPNLLIYATMNTSDQSLFPMDSAFKRRWDWECIPIKFDENSSKISIVFDQETQYSWQAFIEKVNERIQDLTKSEDKKIGVYFVAANNGTEITLDQFKNKVMFYLWSEIFKDEYKSLDSIFKYTNASGDKIDFSFNELFDNQSLEILKGFMNYLEIDPK
jgi:AAA domain (dynein-related subfamily)